MAGSAFFWTWWFLLWKLLFNRAVVYQFCVPKVSIMPVNLEIKRNKTMKTVERSVQSSRLSETDKRARVEYRKARRKLINAIMADNADVLSAMQAKEAKRAFALWLKHVMRMKKYWYDNGNDFAKVLGEVSEDGPQSNALRRFWSVPGGVAAVGSRQKVCFFYCLRCYIIIDNQGNERL